jgi:opacity protein-like surface antigen
MIFKEKSVKRTKKLTLLVISVFSITTSNYTFAIASLSKGIYFNGDIGLTSAHGYGSSAFPPGTSNTTTGRAWSGGMGYKFNPYIGVQADYNGFYDTLIKAPNNLTAAHVRHYGVDLTSMLIFPVYASGFEFYGKLGLGWLDARINKVDPNIAATYGYTFNTNNKTSLGLYWGVGAQYYFNENIAAHIQYAQTQGNSSTANLGMLSLGLSVLFQINNNY